MRSLAAGGDTWGISGPEFLAFYAIISLVVLIGVIVWRRFHTAGPVDAIGRGLTAAEVAIINGGRQLAVYSSLGALRAAGAVGSRNGTLWQSGPAPTGAPDLDRAIYQAAGRQITQRGLYGDATVRGVLERIEAGLIEQGWLLSEDLRRKIRRGSAGVAFALVAFGIARAVAGSVNGRPIGLLLLMMVPVTVVAFVLLKVPRRTRAAHRYLAHNRTGSRHLQPAMGPAWATYGPAGAAMGVALFGAGALWAADPGFAADAEIQRQAMGAGSAGSTSTSCGGSSSSDSGSSGSSCGGGGGGGGGGGCGG